MKTVLKTIITLLSSLFLMLSSVVFAHTGLKTSWPSNEQTLKEAPRQLSLVFQSKVRLATVTVLNDQEEELDIDFKPVMQPQKDFKVALPILEANKYHVNWVAMGNDGHKMKGHFQFIVTNKEAPHTENEVEGHDDHGTHDH